VPQWFSCLIGQPFDLQAGSAEIKQQTDLVAGGFQVRERLHEVDILQLCLRLDLHHHTFDQKIHPLLADIDIPVVDIDPDFAALIQSLGLQFERQGALVDHFFETRSKLAMHLRGRRDDARGDI
jgi:hypothetical protein